MLDARGADAGCGSAATALRTPTRGPRRGRPRATTVHGRAAQERGQGGVGLRGPLELRDVAAVELDVLGGGQRLGHVPREADRDELVAAAPEEERARRALLEPVPEPVLTV